MPHIPPSPIREDIEDVWCQELEGRGIYAAGLLDWLSTMGVWRTTPPFDKATPPFRNAEPPPSPFSRAVAILGGVGKGVHHPKIIGACNAVVLLAAAIDADEQNPERRQVPNLANIRRALIRQQRDLGMAWQVAVDSRDARWQAETAPTRRSRAFADLLFGAFISTQAAIENLKRAEQVAPEMLADPRAHVRNRSLLHEAQELLLGAGFSSEEVVSLLRDQPSQEGALKRMEEGLERRGKRPSRKRNRTRK